MNIIDGKKIAGTIINRLKKLPRGGRIFAAIMVGENPASLSFLKQKEKVAHECGIDFRIYTYKEEQWTNDTLRHEVGRISAQKSVGGVIVQLPLPEKFNAQYIVNAIDSRKDVDVLGERALGSFYAERSKVVPPTVGVVFRIMEELAIKILDKNVAVVGLGRLVGKPIALFLIKKVRNLILCDKNSDLGLLQCADIVISGVGKSHIIKKEHLKNGVIVIDFGYFLDGGTLKGDVDFDALSNYAEYATPTPGGTGPLLVAKLFENFYALNQV